MTVPGATPEDRAEQEATPTRDAPAPAAPAVPLEASDETNVVPGGVANVTRTLPAASEPEICTVIV